MKKYKKLIFFSLLTIFLSPLAIAADWLKPYIWVEGRFDDNVFLDQEDEKEDWITIVSPGLIYQPKLGDHKLVVDYRFDRYFFSQYKDQDSENHQALTDLQLNFNNFHITAKNKFRYFSDRAGAEDTNRVPRTQDHSSIFFTYDFAKVDLSLGYLYRLEDYRTSDAIGSFMGRNLTYQDLDRHEHTGQVELAIKSWAKAAFLMSADYGVILHETAGKPDSKYFDLMTGLRGEPSSKLTIEALAGYRGQNYEESKDFHSLIFLGSIVDRLNSRNILRFDFIRTTNDTTYTDNPYYTLSFVGSRFRHYFTEQFIAEIEGSIQRNDYPVATTEGGITQHRQDYIWIGGLTLIYELPSGIDIELGYEYAQRDSNFHSSDYQRNLFSLLCKYSF